MSNESRETTEMVDDDPKVEVPVSDAEQWSIAEMVDEAIQAGIHSPFMRNEYLYAYYEGKQLRAGLTAPMYNHLGRIEKIIVDPKDTHFTEEDGWLSCSVIATQQVDGETFYGEGFGSRAIPTEAKYKRFIKQTVYSIARRNAIKQLLPFDLIVGTLDKLLTAEKGMIPGDNYKAQGLQQNDHWTPPPQQQAPPQQALPPQQQAPPPQQQQQAPPETSLDRARKQTFAVFRQFKTEINKMGITDELFWESVRANYGVESRADMEESDWRNITSSLRFVDKQTGELFALWIRDLAPKEEIEKPVDADNDESDIPF